MHTPKISVITPSFNQAAYLERTIRSVLDQGYPSLEYIIVDGGSTDGSVDIIRKYADHLTYWVSEPDEGQANAINKGLRRATGDWVGWQNSDDIFYPQAFERVLKVIQSNPGLDVIYGDILLIDQHDHVIRQQCYVKPTFNSLLAEGMVISNQATFWKASIHKKIGYLNESLHYCFDFEWFLRIAKGAKHSYHIPKFIAALRYHDQTKTSLKKDKFNKEFEEVMKMYPGVRYKKYFLIRRFFLTLLNLKIEYLMKGLLRRFKSW